MASIPRFVIEEWLQTFLESSHNSSNVVDALQDLAHAMHRIADNMEKE